MTLVMTDPSLPVQNLELTVMEASTARLVLAND